MNQIYQNNQVIRQSQELQNPYSQWMLQKVEQVTKKVYIINLKVPLIFLELSYYKTNNQNLNEIFQFFGFLMKNMNQANLELTGFQASNTYISDLYQFIIQHYKYQLFANIIQLIGNADIIGNPLRTIQYIRMGIINWFQSVQDGFREGPIPFVKSLGLGFNIFLVQTCLGVFNSIQKVTNSLANGLQILNLDQKYIQEREMLVIRQPKGFVQGINQAFYILQFSLEQVFQGLIIKPIHNIIQQDFKMFLVSIYSGVFGVINKPLIGILDSTSKLALGIKNQILALENIKLDSRIRIPRPFYESNQFLKDYNLIDARIVQLYQEKKSNKMKFLCFSGSLEVRSINKQIIYLAMIHFKLVIINQQISKILKVINLSEIVFCNIINNGENYEIQIFLANNKARLIYLLEEKRNIDSAVINKLTLVSQVNADTNEFT